MCAEKLMKKLIDILLTNLEELKSYIDKEGEQFEYGEKCAYIECLEYVKLWNKADDNGLDFEIEERYPI